MLVPFGVLFAQRVLFSDAANVTVGTCSWTGAPPNQTSDDQDP